MFCVYDAIHLSLLSLLFSFIYPTVSSGTQSIHSHAAKIEIITQKILEMNNRGGDSRINEGKEEAEEKDVKFWTHRHTHTPTDTRTVVLDNLINIGPGHKDR